MSKNIIKINNLKKSFGGNPIIADVNYSIDEGDVSCRIGSSGSGKSTFLRCINLLETPDAGEIIYEGKNILSPEYNIDYYRSKVGMVFQIFILLIYLIVVYICMV